MSIHRNSKGRHEVRWREGSRNRSRTFDRRRDAQDFEAKVRRIRQYGGVVPSRVGQIIFREFSVEWFSRKMQLAAKTRREYVATFERHIDPFLGHMPLNELRPLLLDQWQHERLQAKAGKEAIAKATKLLSQILDRAVELELLPTNPAQTLKRPQSTPRKVTPATPEQVEAMRTWFLDRDRLGDATLLSTLAYVGPRPMEVLALRWSDVHEDRAEITRALSDGVPKETKTGKWRVVELPGPVAQDLREWQVALGSREGLVWPRRRDRAPWRQADWNNWRRRWFKKAAAAAGRPDLVPYDLRHSAASLFVKCGRPLTEVAYQLGHSPEMSARTYQHLIEVARGRPPSTVEEWIQEARGTGEHVSTKRRTALT